MPHPLAILSPQVLNSSFAINVHVKKHKPTRKFCILVKDNMHLMSVRTAYSCSYTPAEKHMATWQRDATQKPQGTWVLS